MYPTSPIETLVSYALAFAAGAVSVCLVRAYGRWKLTQGRLQPTVSR